MSPTTSLRILATEYLDYRRKLGFALRIEGDLLLRFARYAEEQGHPGPLTTALAVQWATLPVGAHPHYWARRLDILRRFAQYCALFDPETEIPPPGLLGPSYGRFPPYIYSDAQITALLEAAAELGPVHGLRPRSYVTLFGLLSCTGLRISEALHLRRDDVDLKSGILTVRSTKFRKSRLVPLHPSTVHALESYAEHRDRYHGRPPSEGFFLTEKATSLKYHTVLMTFLQLRQKLGWKDLGNPRPPRIHDLRHTFTVQRLLRWYEEGRDVNTKIAALSTYLGHVKVSDTYWYLTAVPELLALSATRFEQFAHAPLGGSES